MLRVLSHQQDWALHGIDASRRIEQQALAITEPHALMRRAGAAVASLVRAVAPHARSVWVACGPGNNGGDGLEAAIQLLGCGLGVHVSLQADMARMPRDALNALAHAQKAGVLIGSGPCTISPDVAVDALLGLGNGRPPEGELAERIAELNALNCPVVAVDLPTGLNADTGQRVGKHCVKASHTLSLLTLKPGLFTAEGRDHAGDVWFDPLGVDEATRKGHTAWLTHAKQSVDERLHAQHKGSFGDVAVIGGAAGMAGAAVLAARAAHAAGAGRVYVDLLDDHAPSVDLERPELMFRPAWWQGEPAGLRSATVVCGCGGGDAVRIALPRLLSLATRLVLDADALNVIARDERLQQQLASRSAKGLQTVLTPHPLEAARLLGCKSRDVQADRLAATEEIAQRFHSVVVLKGSGSVIAQPGSLPLINATGNATLATAGTGDVLAGWIGGAWSAAGSLGWDAARGTTWLHGHAADRYSNGNQMHAPLRAADLIDAMLEAHRSS